MWVGFSSSISKTDELGGVILQINAELLYTLSSLLVDNFLWLAVDTYPGENKVS